MKLYKYNKQKNKQKNLAHIRKYTENQTKKHQQKYGVHKTSQNKWRQMMMATAMVPSDTF